MEIKRNEFNKLAEHSEKYCITIYISTIRKDFKKRDKNILMFKNYAKKIRQQLTDMGASSKEADQYQEQIYNLQSDKNIQNNISRGLAIFITKNYYRYYLLPFTVKNFVYVSDHFYLLSLIPYLENDYNYYVLSLSLNSSRFFICTTSDINEIHIPDYVYKNIKEVEGARDKEKNLQFRSSGRKALYHGHGAGKDEKEEIVNMYLRSIDSFSKNIITGKPAPLIIYSVDYLFHMYQEVTNNQYLIDKNIKGNPEFTDINTIHEMANEIISEHKRKRKEKKIKRYYSLFHSIRNVSKDIDQIVPAAYNKRIKAMLIAKDYKIWGGFDEKNNRTIRKQGINDDAMELVNYAAVNTLLNGGEVYMINKEYKNKDESPVNAVFRY